VETKAPGVVEEDKALSVFVIEIEVVAFVRSPAVLTVETILVAHPILPSSFSHNQH